MLKHVTAPLNWLCLRQLLPSKSEKEKDAVYYEVNGGKNGSIYFDGGSYSNMNIRMK